VFFLHTFEYANMAIYRLIETSNLPLPRLNNKALINLNTMNTRLVHIVTNDAVILHTSPLLLSFIVLEGDPINKATWK
jgi:hypothetical protein